MSKSGDVRRSSRRYQDVVVILRQNIDIVRMFLTDACDADRVSILFHSGTESSQHKYKGLGVVDYAVCSHICVRNDYFSVFIIINRTFISV